MPTFRTSEVAAPLNFIVYLTTLSATQATQPWIVDNQLLGWKWHDRNRPTTNLSYHPNTWLEWRRSCSDTAGCGSDWAHRRITELGNNSSFGMLCCVDGQPFSAFWETVGLSPSAWSLNWELPTHRHNKTSQTTWIFSNTAVRTPHPNYIHNIHNLHNLHCLSHAGTHLVKVLRYKPEGRGFDFRWCHRNFSLT